MFFFFPRIGAPDRFPESVPKIDSPNRFLKSVPKIGSPNRCPGSVPRIGAPDGGQGRVGRCGVCFFWCPGSVPRIGSPDRFPGSALTNLVPGMGVGGRVGLKDAGCFFPHKSFSSLGSE